MSILSELNKDLYDKVINLKKKNAYENIPYTIAHTLDTLTGPPKNPYTLIARKGKKWPIDDGSGKCFYDINGQYFCKTQTVSVVNSKVIPNKILKK